MQPEGGVDLVHAPLGNAPHAIAEAFNRDRANLFRLGFQSLSANRNHGPPA